MEKWREQKAARMKNSFPCNCRIQNKTYICMFNIKNV